MATTQSKYKIGDVVIHVSGKNIREVEVLEDTYGLTQAREVRNANAPRELHVKFSDGKTRYVRESLVWPLDSKEQLIPLIFEREILFDKMDVIEDQLKRLRK